MTFSFRPAARTNVSLLIGLAGASGSGKTFTAMRLASGIAGEKRFAVIDTESGRASHYADQFKFDVVELRAPFTPDAYAEAILSADAAGYPVIVVDSMSHEYAGEGGVLDMQEEEFVRMGSREATKMASWIKPKMAHKHMMQKILQVRAHLILCFRAEQKIELVKVDGRLQIVPKMSLTGLDGWIPVTEKNVPFELTASFLLTPDSPGIPKPIKLQEQHKSLFPLDRVIDEESGRKISQWALGVAAKKETGNATSHTDTDFNLGEVIDAFAAIGIDLHSLSAHFGGLPPTASDKPELKRWYNELKRAAKAKQKQMAQEQQPAGVDEA
jgi:hypothetical protein